MTDEVNYVELGLPYANTCITLNRRLNGRLSQDLNHSASEAIIQSAT